MVLEKARFNPFVEKLISQSEVVGPKRKENSCAFGVVKSPDELFLDYTTTILPPKKYLFPQTEIFLKYELGEEPKVDPVVEATDRILLGVHPCDIWAIWEMDKAFSDNNRDTNYLAKREAITIIGLDCLNPDDSCFCTSVGTAVPEESQYDIFLTDLGDEYAVSICSDKGNELVTGDDSFQPAKSSTTAEIKEKQKEKASKITAVINMEVDGLPLFFDSTYDSPVWKSESEKCLSCGSCVMVCPTCFCFDAFDQVELDLASGQRVRQWDGCMRKDFATVASGENFRETAEERLRHRMYRKYQYLMSKYGKSFCVGCGRCGRACLVDINPVSVVNQLIEASQ
jgi:ferredoxin